MANETLKAGFDAYMAKADAASAKFPERALIMKKTSAFLENIPSPVAYSRPCTVANSGPCVCMLVSPLLKNPTNVIVTC